MSSRAYTRQQAGWSPAIRVKGNTLQSRPFVIPPSRQPSPDLQAREERKPVRRLDPMERMAREYTLSLDQSGGGTEDGASGDAENKGTVQRKCADCADEQRIQTKLPGEQPVQRQGEHPLTVSMRQDRAQEPAMAGRNVENGIQQARGKGQPMPEAERSPMEQAFGADFSGCGFIRAVRRIS